MDQVLGFGILVSMVVVGLSALVLMLILSASLHVTRSNMGKLFFLNPVRTLYTTFVALSGLQIPAAFLTAKAPGWWRWPLTLVNFGLVACAVSLISTARPPYIAAATFVPALYAAFEILYFLSRPDKSQSA